MMLACLKQSVSTLASSKTELGGRLSLEVREKRLRFGAACAHQNRKGRQVKSQALQSKTKGVPLESETRRECRGSQLDNPGLVIRNYQELSAEEIVRLRDFFKVELELVLTPWAVDAGRPFPNIRDDAVNIAVIVQNPQTEANKLAIVSVPDCVDRWVKVPKRETSSSQAAFVFAEEVILNNLDQLFGGMDILLTHTFQVSTEAFSDTEDSSSSEDEFEVDGPSHHVLRVDDSMPLELTEVLAEELNLDLNKHVQRICGPMPPPIGMESPLPALSATIRKLGVVSLNGTQHQLPSDVLYSLTRKSRLRQQVSKWN